MAKDKKGSSSTNTFRSKPKKNNKGVHSKCRSSKSKKAKNYRKSYVGQGR